MTQIKLDIDKSPEGTLKLALAGDWKLGNNLPSADGILAELDAGKNVRSVAFDTHNLSGWDSGLITFLLKVLEHCSRTDISVDQAGLPEGLRRILALACAVPEREGVRRNSQRDPFLVRVGESAIKFKGSCGEMLAFIGDAFISLLNLCRGKARFRRSDFLFLVQDCGAQSLPIVSLISLLVGLILAFVGAIQLKMFGAQIYVADLVGIGIVREMGAIMTGIIITGRTGASYAAQLGTMQVNEEIDALQTLGIPAMDFLVIPRMLALCLMMPLLCLYADLMGIIGGLIVGVTMLDISAMEYYLETKHAIHLNDLFIGIFMSAVFGVLVALTGCLRGIQCGRSASAVGEATTSAVVTGIVSIIIATALITVICYIIGI